MNAICDVGLCSCEATYERPNEHGNGFNRLCHGHWLAAEVAAGRVAMVGVTDLRDLIEAHRYHAEQLGIPEAAGSAFITRLKTALPPEPCTARVKGTNITCAGIEGHAGPHHLPDSAWRPS